MEKSGGNLSFTIWACFAFGVIQSKHILGNITKYNFPHFRRFQILPHLHCIHQDVVLGVELPWQAAGWPLFGSLTTSIWLAEQYICYFEFTANNTWNQEHVNSKIKESTQTAIFQFNTKKLYIQQDPFHLWQYLKVGANVIFIKHFNWSVNTLETIK